MPPHDCYIEHTQKKLFEGNSAPNFTFREEDEKQPEEDDEAAQVHDDLSPNTNDIVEPTEPIEPIIGDEYLLKVPTGLTVTATATAKVADQSPTLTKKSSASELPKMPKL